MRIFIDLDGVLVDLVKGVREHFQMGPDWTPDKFRFEYEREFHMTEAEFWWQLDFEFWENLGFTDDALNILEALQPGNLMPRTTISPEVRDFFRPIILTSPTRDNAGAKQAWIKKNMPDYFADGRYVITSSKSYLAGPNRILIDDYEQNIEKWEDAGGIGILYPRPWNYLRGVKHPVNHFKREIRRKMDMCWNYA